MAPREETVRLRATLGQDNTPKLGYRLASLQPSATPKRQLCHEHTIAVCNLECHVAYGFVEQNSLGDNPTCHRNGFGKAVPCLDFDPLVVRIDNLSYANVEKELSLQGRHSPTDC